MSGSFDNIQSYDECPECSSMRCSYQSFQYNAGGCISNHHRIICEDCGYRDVNEPDYEDDGDFDPDFEDDGFDDEE